MTRKRFSRKDRQRLSDLYERTCYLCNGIIADDEDWDIEHVIAWELTRDDSDGNLRLCHRKCHKHKTADDIRMIRKADRVRDKNDGTFPPSPRAFRKRPDGTKFDWNRGKNIYRRHP